MRALAQSWGRGLRPVRSSPDLNRWVSGHARDREVREPSASFHLADGVDQDRKDGRTIRFFEVGVGLGMFDSWQQCLKWCGDRFMPRHASQK